VESTLDALDAALNDAEITAEDLSHVLFVGGSTRIPLVWQMVHDHTGIEPDTTVNPDEAVALGAAAQAAIIAGEPLAAILVDVTPHSLGIEVAELEFGQLVPDRYNVIIQRNTTIPTSRSEVYSALHPTQTAIEIKIYQGEHPVASRNTLLGEFFFDQLKPEAPGQPPRITVQFDFDVNGMLNVSAVDRGSGKQAHTTVKAARAHLSPSDIATARTDLELLEDWEDAALAEAVNASIQPDPETLALLTRAQRVVAEGKGDTTTLQETIAALEAAVRRGDESAVEEQSETLLDLLYELDEE
jgi:molecular chaperone DnaK